MPRHTRRKLAESSVVRAAEEDASDDEAAAVNAPDGGMIPRRAPTFFGTGWSPSDLAFRLEFHLSQRPRAGLADGEPFRTFWSLAELQKAFTEEAMEIWLQTGLVDFWRAMGGTSRRTGIKPRLWALLERWWDTTNTFHMAWGETTITPFEFAKITGLPFSERNVTFDSELKWRSAAARDLLGPVVDLPEDDTHASVTVIVDAIRGVGVSAEQRVRLFLLALVSRVVAPSRNSRVHIRFLSVLQDLRAVSSYNWGGLAYSHLLYEMKWASRTAPESEPSMAALWSVLEVFFGVCWRY
ncbi:protein MAINTENANCE OF MERISTEMS-like [Spinacia oleracea]|uniref:Protein MAINTENANCE OF MERISTEMS-like n=1 Tax=Spinacia oleracea TaxID=3562 RepID=A0ABM3RII8_SPIOL|nr:protein MAINTENANCE OF MERISTEMS-like [Spinacia oleracea]